MVRIVLYTDEPVLAKGLERVLSEAEGMRLVATASLATELVKAVQETAANIVLVDFTPELSFTLLVELRKLAPEARIVLWVRSIATETAYQAMEHGVCGIIKRTQPPEVLLRCLRVVVEGGMWFEETLKASLSTVRKVPLTRRESQLVALLAQGLKNKEIASALFISEGTVKVYLSRLFHKLGVKDRFELALYGLKNMPLGGGSFEVYQPQPTRRPVQLKPPAGSGYLRTIAVERAPVKVPGRGDLFD